MAPLGVPTAFRRSLTSAEKGYRQHWGSGDQIQTVFNAWGFFDRVGVTAPDIHTFSGSQEQTCSGKHCGVQDGSLAYGVQPGLFGIDTQVAKPRGPCMKPRV